MSALAVARASQSRAAARAIKEWLTAEHLSGAVAIRGTLADHFLDEAIAIAAKLGNERVAIGSFGFDNPRAFEGRGEQARLPQMRVADGNQSTLLDVLFSAPSANEHIAAQDHAYAVLDGARIFGLPERLETSGLQHACLFEGNAARDYGASAPWLVRLAPDHRLTRVLTDTKGDQGPLAWAAGPALLIRSKLSLQGLRRQFRNYTMILDSDQNRRVYFRFYDPRTFRTVIVNAQPNVAIKFMRGIELIACPAADGDILFFAAD